MKLNDIVEAEKLPNRAVNMVNITKVSQRRLLELADSKYGFRKMTRNGIGRVFHDGKQK